jgi:hypothetical protein
MSKKLLHKSLLVRSMSPVYVPARELGLDDSEERRNKEDFIF